MDPNVDLMDPNSKAFWINHTIMQLALNWFPWNEAWGYARLPDQSKTQPRPGWCGLPFPIHIHQFIWGFIWICSSAFRPPPSLAPLTHLYSPSIQLAGKGQRPSSAKTTRKAFFGTTCVTWLPLLLPISCDWKNYCQQSFNGNWLQLHASRTRHIYNAPDHYVQL